MQGLSVIVPCYNESKRGNFYERLSILQDYLNLQNFNYEIICVLDGIDEGAVQVCDDLGIKYIQIDKNQGKGYAIRLGLYHTQYDTIMYLDADLSTDINYIARFYREIKYGYSLVIGERHCKRRLISKLGLFITKYLLGLKFDDTQCGFKMFRKSSIKDIQGYFKSTKWLLDIEIILYIQALTGSIRSIPVNYDDELPSTLNSFRASLDSFKELLSILVRRRKVIEQIKNKNK